MKFLTTILTITILSIGCINPMAEDDVAPSPGGGVSLVVLGTVQDAGSPHINCRKPCCINLFSQPDHTRKVVSLGIIDRDNDKTILFEASPDMPDQLRTLSQMAGREDSDIPDAVFVSHAHIGHYTGLKYFGREAMGAQDVKVYAMPRMRTFLNNNGPWSQLVNLKNISMHQLSADSTISIGSVRITAFTVPHRDEFSETVGFIIEGPNKKLMFIPDIDKWEKWEQSVLAMVQDVDYAFLDGTFYDNSEIPNRDMSEIPHPFVVETMALFDSLPLSEKSKINFIHLNHTNPLLNTQDIAVKTVLDKGYKISSYLQRVQI